MQGSARSWRTADVVGGKPEFDQSSTKVLQAGDPNYHDMSHRVLREFNIDFRRVEGLDALVALSMATEGVGVALYLFSFWLDAAAGILAGLILVALGVLSLFFHLGHPLKSWRVVVKSKSAWISRGAAFTAGFLLFAALAFITKEYDFVSIPLQTLAFVAGMAVLLYSGLLFASMDSIPFWNNAVLPVIFLFQSLSSGSLFCLLFIAFEDSRVDDRQLSLVPITTGLMLFSSVLLIILIKSVPRALAFEASLELLMRGPIRKYFRIGALWCGILIPIIMVIAHTVLLLSWGIVSTGILLIGVVLRYVGDVSLRYCILKAGVYEPLI